MFQLPWYFFCTGFGLFFHIFLFFFVCMFAVLSFLHFSVYVFTFSASIRCILYFLYFSLSRPYTVSLILSLSLWITLPLSPPLSNFPSHFLLPSPSNPFPFLFLPSHLPLSPLSHPLPKTIIIIAKQTDNNRKAKQSAKISSFLCVPLYPPLSCPLCSGS